MSISLKLVLAESKHKARLPDTEISVLELLRMTIKVAFWAPHPGTLMCMCIHTYLCILTHLYEHTHTHRGCGREGERRERTRDSLKLLY